MKIRDLFEAPIADFEMFGDLNKLGSFRTDDLRAMRNPKWIENVKQGFSKLKHNLNLYLINAKYGIIEFSEGNIIGTNRFVDVRNTFEINNYNGIHSLSSVIKLIGKTPPNYKQSINLFLLENEGNGRIPLTPWILGHRLAHVIFEASEGIRAKLDRPGTLNKREINFTSEVSDLVFFTRRYLLQSEIDREQMFPVDAKAGIDYASRHAANLLGTMKTARNKNLQSFGEFYVEILTQYIIQGRIKLNNVKIERKDIERNVSDEKMTLFITEKEKNLNKCAAALLQTCVGKSFVI